jgi:hypothetical protein
MIRDWPALMAEAALIGRPPHTQFCFHNSERGRAMDEEQTRQQETEQWLAVRKEAALKIDSDTAEVFWQRGSKSDPHDILWDPPEEDNNNAGRNYFAYEPGSELSVSFDDLPGEICQALRRRAKDGVVPTLNDRLLTELMNMMWRLGEFPESLFNEFDNMVEFLDRTFGGVQDEVFQAFWRRGRRRFEKLIEVANAKPGGRSSTTEPPAKV